MQAAMQFTFCRGIPFIDAGRHFIVKNVVLLTCLTCSWTSEKIVCFDLGIYKPYPQHYAKYRQCKFSRYTCIYWYIIALYLPVQITSVPSVMTAEVHIASK